MMSHIATRFGRKTFFLTVFCILPIRATLYTLVDHPFLLYLSNQFGLNAGFFALASIALVGISFYRLWMPETQLKIINALKT